MHNCWPARSASAEGSGSKPTRRRAELSARELGRNNDQAEPLGAAA
jgi:hypothetical protein